MARSTRRPSSAAKPPGSAPLGEVQNVLTKTRIAPDLLAGMDTTSSRRTAKAVAAKPPMFDVIIEFNRSFPGGISTARLTLLSAYEKTQPDVDPAAAKYREALAAGPLRDDGDLVKAFGPDDKVAVQKSLWTDNYVFARLSIATIQRLSAWTLAVPVDSRQSDGADKRVPLVYKIWRDHRIARCVYKSAQTVKCDAAGTTFGATGKGIVWAVADTGIDQSHPHFRLLRTTNLEDVLLHKDFTQEHADEQASEAGALTDQDGHGTHVAGIIAGYTSRKRDDIPGIESEITRITVRSQERGSDDTPRTVDVEHFEPISGLARHCKLMSLKVLANGGSGDLSNLLAAIGYIQKCNDNGRSLKIHGLNLSLGYPFDPEWFAAGQSPLCVEVDRLVHSGVCVVVAAGNGGYGIVNTYSGAGERASQLFSLTILQGAYSHNALARQVKPGLAGAFPSVVGKPTGPIAITHTHNDLACTLAYALASRLSHDTTQGIGDASDEFGAMGANGPQKLDPNAAEPDDAAQVFAPKRRKVNTFPADQFIVKTPNVDTHNNITNPTVGRLLAKTILA